MPLTATLSNVVKDEATAGDVTYDRTVIKAFVWTAIVGGKAIAAPASLPAEELEVVAVRNNGEVWADFDPDTTEYDIRVTKRDPMPTLEFILNDNSTKVTMPDEFVWGENDVTLTAPNGAEKTYTLSLIHI